ncbi:MAG: hypothetical protein JWN64_126 [Parcubacteria group bacterium]|nr:hypothetical protein [Parcubacteria group bacterium]
MDEVVLDKTIVAPFCPLTDYPSHVIAGMQKTILDLREPNKPVFVLTLLSHVATKLNLNLEANGRGIVIPFKDRDEDRRVYMAFDYITEITLSPFMVAFIYGDKRFKLFPDYEPPVLEEAAGKIEGMEDKDLWLSHAL